MDEHGPGARDDGGGWALTSPDGRHRYLLGRRWGPGPLVLWVLGNPSSADGRADDPTVRRCAGFTAAHGGGGLLLVNLCAWRARDPRELARVAEPVGPGNADAVARAAAGTRGPVVLGWGARADPAHVATVLALLGDRPLHCLGTTRAGHPRHPLYVAASTVLRPWPGEVSR